MSSASFLSAQQRITKHLLFHLAPLVICYHVNKPARFLQKPQIWKLLSLLILIQGVRMRQPLNIGCSLMYLWRRFNLPQNMFNCDHTAARQTLNLEEPNLLWDFPPCSASSNQLPRSQQLLLQSKLGTFVSWAILWPRGPVLLSVSPSPNFFPFLQFHSHISCLLFYKKHWAGLCAECRDEHRRTRQKCG